MSNPLQSLRSGDPTFSFASMATVSLETLDPTLPTTHGGRSRLANRRQRASPAKSVKPNGRLVLVSSEHCCSSTPSLSTLWSTTVLQGILILELASRLDAFSGYPFRTWLLGNAIGMTTETPGVRPSRSSRTRDSSPQDSYAHGR